MQMGWFSKPWSLFALTATFSLAVPGSASVKALLLIVLWTYLLVRRKQFTLLAALWFVSVLTAIAFASEVGFLTGVPLGDVLNQGSRMLIMFLVLSIGLLLVGRAQVTTEKLDRLILAIAVLATLLKIAILVVLAIGLFTSEQLQATLGFETVQDNIGLGLQRLQFPSDIILQFLLVCYVGGRRRLMDGVVLVAITLSVVLSFSRYIFLAYIASLLLRRIFLRRFDFVSRIAVVTAVIGIILLFPALVNRFSGEGTTVSDNTRVEQIEQLTYGIMEHPIFGKGMGSSAHGYTRSDTIPFSYEVQWYALTMQLGVFGVCWLVLNMLAPLLLVLQTIKQRLSFLAVWFVWAASGFTNPFIVSLGSGFGLVLLTLRLITGEPRPAPTRKQLAAPHRLNNTAESAA